MNPPTVRYTASETREKILDLVDHYGADRELAQNLMGSLHLFLDDYLEFGLEKDRFDLNCGTPFSEGEDSFVELAEKVGMSSVTTDRFLRSMRTFSEGTRGVKIHFAPKKKVHVRFFNRMFAPKAQVLNFLREIGVDAKALNQLHRRINHQGEIYGIGFFDEGGVPSLSIMTIDDISRHFPDLRDEFEVPGIIYHRMEPEALRTTGKQFMDEQEVEAVRNRSPKWKAILGRVDELFSERLPRNLGIVHTPDGKSVQKIYYEVCGTSQKSAVYNKIGGEKELEILQGMPFLPGR